jgi:N,N'-diacetyllegionaminate synthase
LHLHLHHLHQQLVGQSVDWPYNRVVMRAFFLQGRRVGAGSPCFVIAEAGVNHNGDLTLAHRLVDAAADAGADAVKFQTFDADTLASADAPKAAYQSARTGAGESQREMLRKLELPRAAHPELKRHAEERGLVLLSSPFDEGSADFLEELGLPAFKVGSGELTNHPFLIHLAKKGRPLLVSTGMSDLGEVDAAVAVIVAAGDPPLALFHCTSSYPAPDDAANLRALATMQQRFEQACVGYSDHSLGTAIPWAAVAMGARLLEKHLTLDRTLPGPDHAASMDAAGFAELVAGVRRIERALGDGVKTMQACEVDTQRVARKSLFAARDLRVGDRLDAAAVVCRRPGLGISPARLPALLGRHLVRGVAAETMLHEEDLS